MGWFKQDDSVRALAGRVDALETAVKLLRVEWEEVYDKVTAAVARNRKRDRDAERAAAPHDVSPNANGPASKAALWARAQHLIRREPHVR
jgi:hypothetical protein